MRERLAILVMHLLAGIRALARHRHRLGVPSVPHGGDAAEIVQCLNQLLAGRPASATPVKWIRKSSLRLIRRSGISQRFGLVDLRFELSGGRLLAQRRKRRQQGQSISA